MKVLLLVLIVTQLCSCFGAPCPCSDPSLCKPIQTGPRKELFVFGADSYKDYDWSRLTTLAWWGGKLDPQAVCLAHSKGARIVLPITNVDTEMLRNTTHTDQLINDLVQQVKDSFLDGVNLDFEDEIDKNDDASRKALTAFMQKLYTSIHMAVPGSQVTFDAGWSPDVDVRYYDYVGLAQYNDFLVIMDYDEQSQIFGRPCIAGATSDYNFLAQGMSAFLALGITADKLVAGLPWYGHSFPCDHQTNATVCPLAPAPWRGCNCTDLYAPEYSYSDLVKDFLPHSTTGRQWDAVSKSPWFNYVENGAPRQMWYDDPESLTYKIQYAKQQNFRGVCMYTGDMIDYNDQQQKTQFWGAMNSFFT